MIFAVEFSQCLKLNKPEAVNVIVRPCSVIFYGRWRIFQSQRCVIKIFKFKYEIVTHAVIEDYPVYLVLRNEHPAESSIFRYTETVDPLGVFFCSNRAVFGQTDSYRQVDIAVKIVEALFKSFSPCIFQSLTGNNDLFYAAAYDLRMLKNILKKLKK